MFSFRAVWLKLKLTFPMYSWLVTSYRMAQLHQLVRILRGPRGCPWDRKQTLKTMLPYLYEEVLELVDASLQTDSQDIEKELGDVLFVCFFVESLLSEKKVTTLSKAASSVVHKMIRRHPHVFHGHTAADTKEIESVWEQIKKREEQNKKEKPSFDSPQQEAFSMMQRIPKKLPSLHQATAIGKAAQKADFDWSNPTQVWEKVREELFELDEAIHHFSIQEQKSELGDLLFSLAQFARHIDIDPEEALQQTCTRFIQRFQYIRDKLKQREAHNPTPEILETLWKEAKQALHSSQRKTDSLDA